MSPSRLCLVLLALVGLMSPVALGDDFVNPKANIPPRATPQRRNAGEGAPPLPMPATPLRRSEKKRQPSPPALIGAITFSPFELRGTGIDSWPTTIIDIEQWVDFTNDTLGQKYRYVTTNFAKFSYDPTDLPILYFTGWETVPDFDQQTILKLRQYLMDGGTLIIHSNCGRPDFNNSIVEQIHRIFPDRELAFIDSDNPIYSAYYHITSMHVRNGLGPWEETSPKLETVNIGTRAAVIFSPIDISCGWNADAQPIAGGILYDQQDALKLASNIVTYCLAEYQYGRFFSHAKIYHQQLNKTRDQLVIGQLIHNGDWDPTPHGLPNLLKMIDTQTTLHVQFKRVEVDPETMDLNPYPVLYMVGDRDFRWSDKARANLRAYLDHGGALVVDDAVGSSEFDAAFRREIKLLYPDHDLTPLPADHPIFNYLFDERTAALAPLARQMYGGDAIEPRLEVIDVDGQLPVIYSQLSMSAGWEQLPRAYDMGYADEDALKLGVNVFMYVVSH
ncbi:MAG TPA: DUF4159 domain-containing protein [Tepidisphaeraceae bacterium]|nr:DUF4159 domain-containing protein [Tepidisphaeraceae bacterium]